MTKQEIFNQIKEEHKQLSNDYYDELDLMNDEHFQLIEIVTFYGKSLRWKKSELLNAFNLIKRIKEERECKKKYGFSFDIKKESILNDIKKSINLYDTGQFLDYISNFNNDQLEEIRKNPLKYFYDFRNRKEF